MNKHDIRRANGKAYFKRKKKRANNPKALTYPNLAPDTVHAYTDGSSNCRDRSGGWGVLLLFNQHRKELHGGKANSTNNEMELAGIYHALAAITKYDYPIKIYSDSQYAVNAVTAWHDAWRRRGWITASGTPVKNVDLIIAITDKMEAMRGAGAIISVHWVKGHAGHAHNEAADKLAGKGRRQYGQKDCEGAWCAR